MELLTVKLRGAITMALPDEEGESARAFFPKSTRQRLAHDNENSIITPYFPYLAVPELALGENPPKPNLTCDLSVEHFQRISLTDSFKRSATVFETISRRERLLLDRSDDDSKARYYIYFALESLISLQVESEDGLTFDKTPVGPTEVFDPDKNGASINWFARLEQISPRVEKSVRSSVTPPNCSTSIVLEKGEIRPVVHTEHKWRFLHSQSGIHRPLADEFEVTINTDSPARFTILFDETDKPPVIVNVQPIDLPVILGNEPIEDIAGVSPIYCCGDPSYDFELQYLLVDTSQLFRRPVPVCTVIDEDHLSPPGAKCGPPVVGGGGGGG